MVIAHLSFVGFQLYFRSYANHLFLFVPECGQTIAHCHTHLCWPCFVSNQGSRLLTWSWRDPKKYQSKFFQWLAIIWCSNALGLYVSGCFESWWWPLLMIIIKSFIQESSLSPGAQEWGRPGIPTRLTIIWWPNLAKFYSNHHFVYAVARHDSMDYWAAGRLVLELICTINGLELTANTFDISVDIKPEPKLTNI